MADNQTNTKQSDLQKAADQVNPTELSQNIKDAKQKPTEQAQDLAKKEETPFIDDSLRTDK